MELQSPDGIDIEFEEDSNGIGHVVPNPDEQLPLDVCVSDKGCFIYDAHGAEVGYWDDDDWADDPKLIVWMVEQMREAYETPREQLTYAARLQQMQMFYDREYPNDDVVWKKTIEETHGPFRELPPLDGHNPINPAQTPLEVTLEDNYSDDEPSVVRIRDGEDVLKEWVIKYTEDTETNRKLGETVAWNIRLAYERPWLLRT